MKLGAFFLCLFVVSNARAQSSATTPGSSTIVTIADVKSIYVPVKPDPGWNDPLWSNPQTIQFQEQLFRSLVAWKKLPPDDPRRKLPRNDPRRTEWGYEGDCEHGITSIISGVRLVCSRKDADAVLLGNVGGSSHDVISTTQSPTPDLSGPTYTASQVYEFTGTATLFNNYTSEAIWAISKDARSGASRLFMPNVSESAVGAANRIAGQLKKDIEAARKTSGAEHPK